MHLKHFPRYTGTYVFVLTPHPSVLTSLSVECMQNARTYVRMHAVVLP